MRPPASLSLDLDNQWSYMKTHGDADWETFPSYLDLVVPRILRFLEERSLKITFFIVGQDAALVKNHEALAAIAEAGHEIGNHSYSHEPWLHLYSREQIEMDIGRAQEAIERVTGQRPLGFRGPGFSLSGKTLDVLQDRGYRYDASTFPTFIGPLARAYYFRTTNLSPEQAARRRLLFGSFSEGFRPLGPYRWRLEGGTVTELPVTTMPIFRTPIHVSYLLYIGMYSHALARAYFRLALLLCRATGVQPSILLHPLDFLGQDDTDVLAFFPGMRLTSHQKLEQLSHLLVLLGRHFEPVSMYDHVTRFEAGQDLPERDPRRDLPAHDRRRAPGSEETDISLGESG